jgi:hypothetical protein
MHFTQKGSDMEAVTGQDRINLYPEALPGDRVRQVPNPGDGGRWVSFVFESPSCNTDEPAHRSHNEQKPETTHRANPQ